MVIFPLPVGCLRVTDVIKAYLSPSLSHRPTGPTQHLSIADIQEDVPNVIGLC